jgi:hypothetical protein
MIALNDDPNVDHQDETLILTIDALLDNGIGRGGLKRRGTRLVRISDFYGEFGAG